MGKKYWLMKSEPDVYSFDDLLAEEDQTDHWEGVRNYQARNFMWKEMSPGDAVLFYHSNCKPPHVAGVAEVASEAYPDHTAWDESSKYYDPKSPEDNPRWYMVDVRAQRKLEAPVALPELKENPALSEMKVIQRGQRLSIQPVTKAEFDEVLRMAKSKAQV